MPFDIRLLICLLTMAEAVIARKAKDKTIITDNNPKTSTAPKLDLGRTKIRLEGLSHYASVSALLLNGALRIFTSTPKKLDDRKQENFVKILFLISVTATIVLGGYTATVFSLFSLYSKTFLGMSMDDEYMIFFKETEPIRKNAFASFLGTIVFFNISFVLSLYLQYEGAARFWITSITGIVIAVCSQNWFLIMQYASHVFEAE